MWSWMSSHGTPAGTKAMAGGSLSSYSRSSSTALLLPHRLSLTLPHERRSMWRGAPEQIEVAHAETVVRPLLVQHHVHALEHRLPPGVRRPAPARRHWRGRRQLIGRHGRQPTL